MGFLALFIIMCGAILVLYFFYENNHKKKINKQYQEYQASLATILNAYDSGRRRIVQRLHDELGNDLSVLQLWTHQLQKENLPDTIQINQILEKLSQSAEKIRSISHELIPTVLESFGLEEAIHDELSKLNIPQVTFISTSIERMELSEEIQFFDLIKSFLLSIQKLPPKDDIKIELFITENQIELKLNTVSSLFFTESLKPVMHVMKTRSMIMGAVYKMNESSLSIEKKRINNKPKTAQHE